MTKSSILAVILAGMTITGCDVIKRTIYRSDSPAPKPVESEKVVTPVASVSFDELSGEWAVTSVNGEDIKVNGENYPNLTFIVNEDVPGSVSVIGFNGCNYLNGAYFVDGTKLVKGGEFISTMKACPDAPYEHAINIALDRAVSYSINHSDSGYMMSLNNESGTPVMILRKHDIEFLNGAWRVDAINEKPVPSSADVQIVIDLDQKTVHGNAGCNILNGTLVPTLDKVNGIEFKDLITTRMTCPDIATEQAFLLALEDVTSAGRDGSDDKIVLKNSDGKAIVNLTRLKLTD